MINRMETEIANQTSAQQPLSNKNPGFGILTDHSFAAKGFPLSQTKSKHVSLPLACACFSKQISPRLRPLLILPAIRSSASQPGFSRSRGTDPRSSQDRCHRIVSWNNTTHGP